MTRADCRAKSFGVLVDLDADWFDVNVEFSR